MIKISDLPKDFQKRIRLERAQARTAAKAFIEACRDGNIDRFRAAIHALVDNSHANWTAIFRRVARLGRVPEAIQQEFQLWWIESRLSSRCGCDRAVLDALRVLLPPYRGPAVHLFRGANAHEARARKFYGVSWSSGIEEADWFARHYQSTSGGTVVLETHAPPEAIIAAPGIIGPHFESVDGKRLYDEREYVVDGRRLQRVIVARRYPEISIEEQAARDQTARSAQLP